jgi:hypothetical protein
MAHRSSATASSGVIGSGSGSGEISFPVPLLTIFGEVALLAWRSGGEIKEGQKVHVEGAQGREKKHNKETGDDRD